MKRPNRNLNTIYKHLKENDSDIGSFIDQLLKDNKDEPLGFQKATSKNFLEILSDVCCGKYYAFMQHEEELFVMNEVHADKIMNRFFKTKKKV